MSFVVVATGGALGALLRYLVSAAIGTHLLFPWATLAINIAGSFAIGFIWGGYGHADWFQQWGRLLLVVGLLGGFTTFSAFSLETLMLMQAGKWVTGTVYVGASVLGCLLAVFVGERLGQDMLP